MIPRRYLPSMPSLLALEAVDRLGSASAAAVELNLTQGAISRQLQVLEGQLGVTLLIRDKHRLRLTPAAQDYVREVRRALQSLAQASLTLRANPTGGALNLAILPAFGMHWLAPRLARFAAQHPEVTVNLSTRLKPFDFSSEQFRRRHPLRPSGLARRRLSAADGRRPAGRRRPRPAEGTIRPRPMTFSHIPCCNWKAAPAIGAAGWRITAIPGQRPPAMLFDQFATMTQGAIHGLGLALLPLFLIERELAEHRLIPAFGTTAQILGQLFPRLAKRPARRARHSASFSNWLRRSQNRPETSSSVLKYPGG